MLVTNILKYSMVIFQPYCLMIIVCTNTLLW